MTQFLKKFDATIVVTVIIGVAGLIFTLGALFNIFHKRAYNEPVSVMNLSQFEKADLLGTAVFKRYWVEINEHPVVVIGVSSQFKDYLNYLEGIVSAASQNKFHFDSVYSEAGVQAPNSAGPVQMFEPSAVLHDVGEHKKVLVLMILTDERLEKLREQLPEAFVVAQGHLPMGDEEIAEIKARCQSTSSPSPLACQAVDAAHAGKLRSPKEGQTTAAIMHEDGYEIVFVR